MSTPFEVRHWAAEAGIKTTGGFAVVAEFVTLDELERFAQIAISAAAKNWQKGKTSTRFHDSDCAIHRSPAYPAGEVGCDCRLAELDKSESSYNAVCDERDAIAKDCNKAHALLRWAETEMRYAGWGTRINDQHGRTDVYEAIVEFLK